MNIRHHVFCLLAACLLLSACSNQVTVTGQFPQPLTAPMPLTGAAFYSPELTGHHYIEQSDDRDEWTIQTGTVQQQFFDTLLPALFQRWSGQSPDPASDSFSPQDVDVIVKPHLSDFQYSLPRESRSKVFEVWLKYNMQLYKSDGQLLADWFISAYGKTPSAFMRSNEAAMNAAIVIALRDLGANLSLNLARVPELQDWLEQRRNDAQAQTAQNASKRP